jgi:hypothetical protein
VIPADERVAVHLAFAEERALVRAVTLVCSEPGGGFDDDEVEARRRQREWTVALEIGEPRETGPRLGETHHLA